VSIEICAAVLEKLVGLNVLLPVAVTTIVARLPLFVAVVRTSPPVTLKVFA
jgi:hypothetical protein